MANFRFLTLLLVELYSLGGGMKVKKNKKDLFAIFFRGFARTERQMNTQKHYLLIEVKKGWSHELYYTYWI